ncbi:hypothetical protein CC78DRAFT_253526 [Lojkania enalia]|uniref:Apple domain-containing protein n=1 Tax=Lojkania enalia TaxID=147567 RepID=A0A9P4KAF2_9PLEO|nr:hypothetical protein CC78DRAFT_253526 [Didymosphaeria enalia]
MLASIVVSAALAGLAAAMPTAPFAERAGGPAIVPVPPSCTVTHPLPSTTSSDQTYKPCSSTDDVSLYSAYYPSFSTNTTFMAEQCLQQCYGYGDHTECKAAYWAENLVIPEGYRGAGGIATGCLFYTRELHESDFVVAPANRATTPFAANLKC